MFHGGVKYSTEGAKFSTEVLNIPRSVPNDLRRYQMFHAGCKMIHGGAKCSTEGVKCSMEVLNIPRRC